MKIDVGLIIIGGFLTWLVGFYCGCKVTDEDMRKMREGYERRLQREARW